jgi:hypothetical protein
MVLFRNDKCFSKVEEIETKTYRKIAKAGSELALPFFVYFYRKSSINLICPI